MLADGCSLRVPSFCGSFESRSRYADGCSQSTGFATVLNKVPDVSVTGNEILSFIGSPSSTVTVPTGGNRLNSRMEGWIQSVQDARTDWRRAPQVHAVRFRTQ